MIAAAFIVGVVCGIVLNPGPVRRGGYRPEPPTYRPAAPPPPPLRRYW